MYYVLKTRVNDIFKQRGLTLKELSISNSVKTMKNEYLPPQMKLYSIAYCDIIALSQNIEDPSEEDIL